MRHNDSQTCYDSRLALLWERAVYEEHTAVGIGWLQKEADALANNFLSHRSSIQACEGV
jgi:hypothetical protein